jgi:hypothetical protein
VDGQDTMSGVLDLSRKALADFFVAMEAQHAHWYCIKSPTIGETNCLELKRIFPPLSSLLNIQDEVLMSVLKVAGLLCQRGNMISPLLRAWEDLFAEFQLKNELTTFSILGKQQIFIRIGTWSQRHPSVTPKIVWSTRDKYRLPKLRISTIMMAFASYWFM